MKKHFKKLSPAQFEKLLACPNCHTQLLRKKSAYTCLLCHKVISIKNGIIVNIGKNEVDGDIQKSRNEYEQIHEQPWDHITDGSYEILASFARGNRTIDIACGDGFVEELAPETVGVDFSYNALKKAKKRGAKYLVCASAESLPFRDNAFEVAICAGSLEHFVNPQQAINEMARISHMQILTVHRLPPLPAAPFFFEIFSKWQQLTHQPIEKPIHPTTLKHMVKTAGLRIIFDGNWQIPINYGRVVRWLPEFRNWPACSFIISVKIS